MAIVELHVHGRPHKHGGNAKLMEIARIAKSQGTDCLVLTEHCHTKDFMGYKPGEIDDVMETHDINILVGAELKTKEFGDVLVYGKDIHEINAGMEICDIPPRFCLVWAHPMRRQWAEETWSRAEDVFKGIEVMNKSYTLSDSRKALDYSGRLCLSPVGGSDIHLNRHVGICPCYLPFAEDMADIHWCIEKGKVTPLGWPTV